MLYYVLETALIIGVCLLIFRALRKWWKRETETGARPADYVEALLLALPIAVLAVWLGLKFGHALASWLR